MLRYFNSVLFIFFGVLFGAGNALAADVALVLGNTRYQDMRDAPEGDQVLESAKALQRAGFTIVSGRNISGAQSQAAIDGLLSRINGADHVAVVLGGNFVRSDNDTWFLPTDARPENLANVYGKGLSLNVLLDILSDKPGRAVVFLAASDSNFKTATGLQTGIGELNIPQGLLVVQGPAGDLNQSIRRGFLSGRTGFADALERAPDTVSGAGFVSNLGSLTDTGVPGGVPRGQMDDGYWQAVTDIGTAGALRAYLQAYPDGRHADEARARLDPPMVKIPQETASDKEAALQLGTRVRRDVQRNLTYLGYNTFGVDGVFGRASRRAISAWQADQALTVTGFLTLRQIDRLARQAANLRSKRAQQAQQKKQERDARDRDYWVSSGAIGGNERALRQYVQQFPNGLFLAIAIARLNTIADKKAKDAAAADLAAWQQARTSDTRRAYVAYLQKRPNGRYVQNARNRIAAIDASQSNKKDRSAWNNAAAIDTRRAYNDYLARFPNGLYAQNARDRLAALRGAAAAAQEKNAWNNARAANTIAGYNAFLAKYPNGVFSPEARTRLGALQAPAPAPANGGNKSDRQEEKSLNLDRGYKGTLELYLKKMGYDPGPVDGKFTKATRNALRRYQASKGLNASGFFTRKIIAALTAEAGGRP